MVDKKDKAAFSQALRRGDLSELESILSELPDILEHPSGTGNWLQIAASRCSPEVVRWLIAKGQDVNETSKVHPFGTALGRALSFENLEVARVLLAHGADPNKDGDRCTITPVNGQKKKRPLEALQLLLEFGADFNKQYKHHGTGFPINALSMAIDSNLKEVVQFLEANGCAMPTPIEE